MSDWNNPNNYKQRFKSVGERLWEKVNKKSDNKCWEWLGCKNGKGYGMIHFETKMVTCHRMVWELSFGKIQDNLQVLHHCDNPSCVNPKHLFLGTNQDNVDDKMKKKRMKVPKGEQHPNSKLTEKDIIIIRKMKMDGKSLVDIGERFGVTSSNICYILKGKGWVHV